MAFHGKYQLESQEGFQLFKMAFGLKGIMQELDHGKTTYEIEEKGDHYKMTSIVGDKVVRNTFTLGKATTMKLMFGDPTQGVVHREGKKLKATMKLFTSVWELVDPNTLVIILTRDRVSYKRVFKRVA